MFDRLDGLRRDDAVVRELWRTAVVVRIGPRGGFGVTLAGDQVTLQTTVAMGDYDPERHWLLGRDGVRVMFAESVPDLVGDTIREVGARLSPAELELATMAAATAEWHRLEPCCPQCGGPTGVCAAGAARWCAGCERELFPRTDPAVIVAVVDRAGRLLLGRQGVWPEGRHSVLAGFVEAGESLEQAVHREVFEEVGVRLADVSYVASQPWPFPRSIMLGFRATAETTDIVVDGSEIVSARWFTQQQLRDEVTAGALSLPGQASIAHRLISAWLTQG